MKIYYPSAHSLHYPPFEILDGGEKIRTFEVPDRVENILTSLKKVDWAELTNPETYGLDPILAVHDEAYVNFIRTAFEQWMNEDANYEHVALTPATFPPGRWRRLPASVLGKAGFYMMDLSAPVGPGTYQAALQSVDCALSGADALVGGENAVFALCRPPGHHSGKANCGGYCYFNNASIAANHLSSHGKVALLDIDYHAGNGTQDIFYRRNDVLSISIHADPAYEYPYYSGYADEIGEGVGEGYHRNFPLKLGTNDDEYLAALDNALELIKKFNPKNLVLSVGMDIYQSDPLGKFRITREGVRIIGKRISALDIPTLAVMEGGYDLDGLGENVVALLENFT